MALESDEALSSDAEAALGEANADNVAVVTGPLAEGSARHGPYDVIVLQGAVEEIPVALTDQLKDGGRIACVFMEGALGVCRIGHKNAGAVDWRYAFNGAAPVLPGFARAVEFQL